jgi:hypothetical protein
MNSYAANKTKEMSKILIIEEAAIRRVLTQNNFRRKRYPSWKMQKMVQFRSGKNKKITITIWFCAISKCQNGWC